MMHNIMVCEKMMDKIVELGVEAATKLRSDFYEKYPAPRVTTWL